MSSSESEAPETINLKAAKKQSKRQAKELQERQQVVARQRKEKNQAKDVKLKAESASKKRPLDTRTKKNDGKQYQTAGKDEDVDEERARLEERMARAMAAAEDGSSDENDDSDVFMQDEDNETVSEESEVDEEAQISVNPDYLPDHYFEQSESKEKATV
ncbi:hypothetical protein M408DRAFT_6648 [Serendipita vermifera MAFF 305830]|uniref:Uncharacterized protein n=1 Tax=Serendipita vermifera MAFF 305830 TaxID=933852 RepID=A0A0C3BK46_SERVB|nr:hypothetical protein M408DRAFT_6648 [Serendipita vermifera MAFF 305830]